MVRRRVPRREGRGLVGNGVARATYYSIRLLSTNIGIFKWSDIYKFPRSTNIKIHPADMDVNISND